METHCYFTDDLVEEILLRLPVRDLLRWRCVSKSWCVLIDNASFIEKHHKIQYAISQEEGDVPLFLINKSGHYMEPSQFYLLSKKQGDNILCLTSDVDRDRVPSECPFRGVYCMGIANGVVGLSWQKKQFEDMYFGLWNPATREFKAVPPPQPIGSTLKEVGLDILGFGFDRKSNDFKLVRSIPRKLRNHYTEFKDDICEMYSLSTNSWTRLELPLYTHPQLWMRFSHMTDGYYNGVYYWTAAVCDWKDCKSDLKFLIISFDFSTETFKYLDPPHAVVTAGNARSCWSNFEWMVGQYMERLATIFSHGNPEQAIRSFDIWVACEFDVGYDSEMSLSWQHLYTIGPYPSLYAESFVAFRMDGDVLLNLYPWNHGDECNLYNPLTHASKGLGFMFESGYNYVESLYSLSKRHDRGYQDSSKLKKRKKADSRKDATFVSERYMKYLKTCDSMTSETHDFRAQMTVGLP